MLDYQACLTCLEHVSNAFSGLFHFVFSDYVACFGVHYFEASMKALALFTQNSTAEFAIRPFLNTEPERTRSQLLSWAKSDNHHLRRLASEGVRPYLPWAEHLPWVAENPDWVKPIIQLLKSDSSPYVRKSVANLLNDLTKSQPDWVLMLFRDWMGNHSAQVLPKETQWIIKHALRTLLKAGHPQALAIMGYSGIAHLTLRDWQIEQQVAMGQRLTFSFGLQAHSQSNLNPTLGHLRLEYTLFFLRKQSQPYRKVFKINEAEYQQAERAFTKTHNFKLIRTRTYYPGVHKIELLVNGQVMHTAEFELID